MTRWRRRRRGVAAANRKALFVGINGSKEAIDVIKAGKMLATGDYNGFVQGCIGTIIAARTLRKAAGRVGNRAEADGGEQGELSALRHAGLVPAHVRLGNRH